MRHRLPFAIIVLNCILAGCQSSTSDQSAAVQVTTGPSLRAPVWDAEFRGTWDDGTAEVSTYTTERLRGGSLRKGTATAILRRTAFLADDRVADGDGAQKTAQQRDLFPVMQMNWVERYSVGVQSCEEMTTSVVTLSAVEGRAAGTETKTDFSAQSWDGQLFHQLLFDATGIRSLQYSFQKEGDEQLTLSYPRDGVSGDALWFWSRGMASPVVDAGRQRIVDLLPRLRDVRMQHQPLSWKKATLTHQTGSKGDEFAVSSEGARKEMFVVEKAPPFRVLHWENSDGEHVELVSSSRMKSWEQTAAAGRR